MNRRSKTVLEKAKAREVVGILLSRKSLRESVDALLLAGFDRADLDVMGSVAQLRKAVSDASISLDEIAGTRRIPKKVPVGPEDITLVHAMVVGVLGFIAAAGASAIVIASDGSAVQAAIAATLAGCVAAALSGYVFALRFKPQDVLVLDQRVADRGVMLWVRVDSPDEEEKAKSILLAHGAKSVRTLEAEVTKTIHDIPLSRLRPDPLIPVRLGDL
jgi:hypothetical protein